MIEFVSAPFLRLYRYRRVLAAASLGELKSTYAGSALGLIWILLGPLLLLVLYTVIYAVIFRIRPSSMTMADYILYVFSGLVPLMAFGAALTSGANVLSHHRQHLLNTVFPAELLPVRSVLVASASLPVGMILVFAGDLAFSAPSWTLLLTAMVFLAQILFTCGVVWILSLLTLLVHDIQHGLQYVMVMLLIATPIGYTPDMIPPKLQVLMYGNPMFYFVASYQSLIIFNRLPPLEVIVIGLSMSLAVFLSGYWIFQRAKMTFYEYA